MSNKPNDGGSAFPRPRDPDDNCHSHTGMSLRDYLAAKAMAAVVANGYVAECLHEVKKQMGSDAERNAFDTDVMPKVNARFAYAQADAMLAEREKGSK